MTDPILIIDNIIELEELECYYPKVKIAPIILLSSNFSQKQLNSFEKRTYMFYDEVITNDDAHRISKDIHFLVWNWFIDENGIDLSQTCGCSLGSAFATSVEHILYTLLRYLTGLNKVLKKKHTVYCCSTTEDIFFEVIVYLQKEIGFTLCLVESDKYNDTISFGKLEQKIDVAGRKRDLTTLFQQSNLKKLLVFKLLINFHIKIKKERRVLFVPAGKHETYFEHLRNIKSKLFRWVLPISEVKDLFNKNSSRPQYYSFPVINNKQNIQIQKIIQRLKKNILKRDTIIPPELLINVMKRHTFVYFNNAFSYYTNTLKILQSSKPDLVILSADRYENYILIAQAAKHLNVKTSLIGHGLVGSGALGYYTGRFHLFDYGLAFGQVDVNNYLSCGLSKERIYITSFPYFERFLPLVPTTDHNYKRVLLLIPDTINVCAADKIDSDYRFFDEIHNLMEELNIEVIGIKAKHQFQYRNLGITEDVLKIKDNAIPLLSNFPFCDAVNNADFVIGPASTALIETNLLGKDYYLFQHTAFHKYSPSILPSLFDFVNASFDIVQLRKNIQNRQPYKEGCSINDLIDLEGVKTKEDLYHKFESGIQAVLDDIAKSKNEPTTIRTIGR
jgi:hypothetical protein